jgi:hypothetical protein
MIRFINTGRIRWFGNVQKMNKERMTKRIMDARMEGTRRHHRPRSKRLDEVKKDRQLMGIQK